MVCTRRLAKVAHGCGSTSELYDKQVAAELRLDPHQHHLVSAALISHCFRVNSGSLSEIRVLLTQTRTNTLVAKLEETYQTISLRLAYSRRYFGTIFDYTTHRMVKVISAMIEDLITSSRILLDGHSNKICIPDTRPHRSENLESPSAALCSFDACLQADRRSRKRLISSPSIWRPG